MDANKVDLQSTKVSKNSLFRKDVTSTSRNSILELLADLENWPGISCALHSAEEPTRYVLHAEEQKALSGKELAKSRAEFISGRAATNRAILKLGISSPGPVLRGSLGEPLWPQGIVGSITHSHPWAIAVVARSKDVAALGIDLESVSQVSKHDITGEICTLGELQWALAQPHASVALGGIFSAKEALYKCLSPRCGRRFDFKDVELSWIPDKSCFAAELQIDLGSQYARGYRTDVHIRAGGDLVFAYIIEVAP